VTPPTAYHPQLMDYPPEWHQTVLDDAVDIALRRGFLLAYDHFAVWGPTVVELAAEAWRDARAVVEINSARRNAASVALARTRTATE
jgi:hypothetical protein